MPIPATVNLKLWELGWCRMAGGPVCLDLVYLAMECAAADSEFFCSLRHVSRSIVKRLENQ
jgi:hypothetical protein